MWLVKQETQLEDDTIELVVEIHSPCCRGIKFKYYFDTKLGKIYNHQYVEVGEAAKEAIERALVEFRKQ